MSLTKEQVETYKVKLQERRRKVVDALKDSSVEGMWTQVVDKYSDQAHFLYEILQNADDAKATYAKFILFDDKLIFKHNGTRFFSISDVDTERDDKRNGVLGDINAITSVGQSNKIDTSKIGKFGMGFKSVFQYTNSPSIYDSNFRFEISDYMIPNWLEEDYFDRKSDETIFVFPFNREDMSPVEAKQDILDKLKNLVLPVLFLRTLSKIEYECGSEKGAYSRECLEQRNFDSTEAIRYKVINCDDEYHLWLFSREDENKLRYSVGFFIDKLGKLSPQPGFSAFCFFPTKVDTHLNFIIHAPFLLTDSREGIKARSDHNVKMIQNLAELSADALEYFVTIGKDKSIRMIDDEIIKVIPIKRSMFEVVQTDSISLMPFYTIIQNKMSAGLLPTKDGCVAKTDACWAETINLSELISVEQLQIFMTKLVWDSVSASYKTRKSKDEWVFVSLGKRNNPDLAQYLKEIGVNDYSIDDLLPRMDNRFIECQPVEWLCQLYGLICGNGESVRKAKKAPIFLNEEKKASAAFVGDIANLFLNSPNSSGYNVVLKDIEENENGSTLLKKLEVAQPVLKDKIYQKILKKSEFDAESDFKDFLDYFIECKNKENNAEKSFIEKIRGKAFLSVMNVDGDDRGISAPNSYIYSLNDGLKVFFSALKEMQFVNKSKYEEILSVNEKQYLDEFLEALGISSYTKIVERNSTMEEFREAGELPPYSTRGCSYYKYYLCGAVEFLDEVLSKEDLKYSLILLQQMCHGYKNAPYAYGKDRLFGFRCNYFFRNNQTKFASDSVASRFQTERWLLDNDGGWVSPQETFLQRLSNNYNISDLDIQKFFTEYLGIKKEPAEYDALDANIRKKVELSDVLERFGLSDISEEELKMLQKLRKKKEQQPLSGSLPDGSDDGDDGDGDSREKITKEIVQLAKRNKKVTSTEVNDSGTSKDETPQEDDEDEDEYTRASVDYDKKIQKAKEKCAVEINELKEYEAAQALAVNSERYSYRWFTSLLKLEILSSSENNSSSREVSISFGRVEKDPTSKKTLILKQPNKNIPSIIEELYGINLILCMSDGSEKPVTFDAASIHSFSLKVMLMRESDIAGVDFSQVVSARILAKSPVFLLQELQKQFDALDFDSEFNMKDSLCENIKFVFGPPGTGKTTFLSENVLKKLVRENDDVKILVLAPTNKAADVIVNRTIEKMENDDSYKDWLVRFGTTNDESIEEKGIFCNKNYDIEKTKKSVIVTTIARYPYDGMKCEGKADKLLRDVKWDYVVIDEASMIPLFQIIYVLYSQKPKQFIVAGDPFQIEPTAAVNMWKDENIYKMVELNSFTHVNTVPRQYEVELLKTQYRSIPSVGKIFSSLTYEGALAHHRDEYSKRPLNIEEYLDYSSLNLVKFPVHRYESIYRSKKLNKSNYQIYSALFAYEFVTYLAKKIAEKNPSENFKIGVISPYGAQAKLINNLLLAEKLPSTISVLCGTIHGFQGDECDVLLTVFNAPEGMSASDKMFLNHQNIINVAISRARDYLFVLMPDDNTDKIENLKLVKKVESLMKENPSCTEIGTHELEGKIFGREHYLEENTFSTGHQSVNVYGLPEKIYEVRSEDDAIDIQLHKS